MIYVFYLQFLQFFGIFKYLALLCVSIGPGASPCGQVALCRRTTLRRHITKTIKDKLFLLIPVERGRFGTYLMQSTRIQRQYILSYKEKTSKKCLKLRLHWATYLHYQRLTVSYDIFLVLLFLLSLNPLLHLLF